MNWQNRIYESLTEGKLKRQREKQTAHGARPSEIRYVRGGKKKGSVTWVGRGHNPKTGTTVGGKPRRRRTHKAGTKNINTDYGVNMAAHDAAQIGDTTASQQDRFKNR